MNLSNAVTAQWHLIFSCYILALGCVFVTAICCVTFSREFRVCLFLICGWNRVEIHVLQVNKRGIERGKARGGLCLSLASGPPCAASDISSLPTERIIVQRRPRPKYKPAPAYDSLHGSKFRVAWSDRCYSRDAQCSAAVWLHTYSAQVVCETCLWRKSSRVSTWCTVTEPTVAISVKCPAACVMKWCYFFVGLFCAVWQMVIAIFSPQDG